MPSPFVFPNEKGDEKIPTNTYAYVRHRLRFKTLLRYEFPRFSESHIGETRPLTDFPLRLPCEDSAEEHIRMNAGHAVPGVWTPSAPTFGYTLCARAWDTDWAMAQARQLLEKAAHMAAAWHSGWQNDHQMASNAGPGARAGF
jgi:hypothetical protein